MRNHPSLTLADVQSAVQNTIKAAMEPLASSVSRLTEKVDILNADRVKQVDMQDLRREMQQGFAGLEAKYVNREIAEQRFKELANEQQEQRQQMKDMQDAQAGSGMKQWQLIGLVAGVAFGFLSLLINMLGHISYHP